MTPTQTNGPSGPPQPKPIGGRFGFPVFAEPTPPACSECGGPCKLSNIAADDEPPQWVSLSRICPTCATRIRREHAENRREAEREEANENNRRKWEAFGPYGEDNTENIYRGVEFDRLPHKALAEQVIQWSPRSRQGMIIFGETSQGKTFMLYALAKRLILEHGIEPLLMTGPGLRTQISEAARHAEPSRRAALIARMVNAPVLMIDDLGQAAKSDTAEEALWEIAEGRTSRNRPTIVTTNFIGESFANRFLKPETGAAVIRRLSQFAKTFRAATI